MIVQKYKYQFKYIIIGDTGVGKSCLVLQFVQKSVKQSHDITIGVEFAKKLININNLPIQLQLWDTAGQENFRSITRQYYKSAIGALLVYDITRRDSFLSVEKWLEELKDNSDHNISIILVGNKKDMANRREVEFDEGYALAQKYNLLFSEASAFNGEGVDKMDQRQNQKPNLIFLDIDGVMQLKKAKQIKNEDAINFQKQCMQEISQEFQYIVPRDIYQIKYCFLPDAIEVIQELCEKYYCKIVISSSWRLIYNLNDLKLMFSLIGLDTHIIGETPELEQFNNNFNPSENQEFFVEGKYRYKEIQKYMELNSGTFDGFVILDDKYTEQFETYFKNNFVQVKGNEGLSKTQHMEKILQILNLKND
ncbi:P-loop containing nucleoside triphosphate hydrolase [Pseudocohnilembus persalinus]|uniref:p-loop containing nucleoside triphosphate hydrolase n=1 Tax=Pseudocohnilembus persalinus TaxID=266149 RepID=A0A0V0QT63_PSEPJ|nr:P-loop containing nucleoside triphosphate hydrolase [Pseudocohnilembus persalinus]|eukprot:KRX05096.1 P-loop containing nucleoside triphosphate hydrolase [Pseudocohnilembus persalinus]